MKYKNLSFIKNFNILKDKLGPHAIQILRELENSIKNKNYLTIIILSATAIDVIKNENSSLMKNLSGIEINSLFSSRDAIWLRQRRNEIIHHEGVSDGLFGSQSDYKDLSSDSNKSIKILSDLLDLIFK